MRESQCDDGCGMQRVGVEGTGKLAGLRQDGQVCEEGGQAAGRRPWVGVWCPNRARHGHVGATRSVKRALDAVWNPPADASEDFSCG